MLKSSPCRQPSRISAVLAPFRSAPHPVALQGQHHLHTPAPTSPIAENLLATSTSAPKPSAAAPSSQHSPLFAAASSRFFPSAPCKSFKASPIASTSKVKIHHSRYFYSTSAAFAPVRSSSRGVGHDEYEGGGASVRQTGGQLAEGARRHAKKEKSALAPGSGEDLHRTVGGGSPRSPSSTFLPPPTSPRPFPPPGDPPPLTPPPSAQPSVPSRGDLMKQINSLPSSPTSKQLLDLRSLLILRGLTDTAPTIRLIQVALKSDDPIIGVRLLKQSLQTLKAADVKTGTSLRVIEEVLGSMLLLEEPPWDSVLEVTNIALHHEEISAKTLRARFSALVKLGRTRDVIQGFEIWKFRGFEWEGRDWDELISAHLRNSDFPAAQEALRQKSMSGFGTSPQTVVGLLDGMVGLGGSLKMEERILSGEEDGPDLTRKEKKRSALRQNSMVLNKIMSVRAHRGDVERALHILDYFNLQNIPPQLPPFTKISSTTSSSLSEPSCSSPSTSTSPPSPLPTRPLLSTFRPPLDIASITTLIGIALRRECPTTAFTLAKSALDMRLSLTNQFLETVVKTILIRDGLVAAEKIVFDLQAGETKVEEVGVLPKFEPTTRVHELLLDVILRERGVKGAVEYFDRVLAKTKKGLIVSERMVGSVVHHLSVQRSGKSGQAAMTILKMADATDNQARATIDQLNSILLGLVRKERFSQSGRRGRGQRWLRASKRLSSLSPTPPTLLDSNMPTPASSSSPPVPPSPPTSHLQRVRQSVVDRSLPSNSTTTEITTSRALRVRTLQAVWKHLERTFAEDGIKPSRQTINLVIRAHVAARDFAGAQRTMDRAVEMGVERHVSFYSVLIDGAVGKDQSIVDWAQRQVRDYDLETDKLFFNSLALNKMRRRDVKGVFAAVRNGWGRSVTTRLRPGPSSSLPVAPSSSSTSSAGTTPSQSTGWGWFNANPDPFFVAILYRLFVTLCRPLPILRAQLLVRRCLKRGMVPDKSLYLALLRTRRWFRYQCKHHLGWETNRLVLTARLQNLLALREIRKVLQVPSSKAQNRELLALEELWRSATRSLRKTKRARWSWKRWKLKKEKSRRRALLESVVAQDSP